MPCLYLLSEIVLGWVRIGSGQDGLGFGWVGKGSGSKSSQQGSTEAACTSRPREEADRHVDELIDEVDGVAETGTRPNLGL